MNAVRAPTPPAVQGTGVLVAIAVFGSMVLGPSVAPNIAVTDLVIAGAIALGFSRMGRRGSPSRRLFGRSLPWLWLILLGSLAGLTGVGLTGWAIDTLVRDAFSFAIFYAFFELTTGSGRVLRIALDAVAVSVVLLALAIAATGQAYRPAGTFANPNYAGHFLAFGATLLLASRYRSPAFRGVLLALAGIAIFRTGSFGSVAMVLGGALFYMLHRVRRERRWPLRLAFCLVLALFLASLSQAYRVVDEHTHVLGPSVPSYRLKNTTTVREQLWSQAISLVPDHPLGVGPFGLKSRDLLQRESEVHNDLLAYLVERSVIGLVGLLGLFTVLWRNACQGGASRLLLVMLAVGGMFRETLHFRHAWIFLAVAYAYDHFAESPKKPSSSSTPYSIIRRPVFVVKRRDTENPKCS